MLNKKKRGKKIEFILVSRCDYLKNIKNRLEDEVGSYFEMLNKHNRTTTRTIGFWSSIRLLMPIIEATSKSVSLSSQELLSKLDVKTPHLVWEMFRHPLLHGDQLAHVKYKDRQIEWGLSIGSGKGSHHIIGLDHVSLDVNFLYDRLLTFLNEEIKKNDIEKIKVAVGIIFDDSAPQYILDDLEKVKENFNNHEES